MKIETKRLILIPITYDFVCNIMQNKTGYLDKLGYKINIIEWKEFELANIIPIFKGQLGNDTNIGFCPWLIISKDNNFVIGNCGCHGEPDKEGNVEIGYEISEKYRNQGFAIEAVQEYILWLKSQSIVKSILAECDKNNRRSINLLKKLGMKKINKFDNIYIFRL